MKFTREVKTALLAIIAILLLIFGYSFLKGKNLLESSRVFYAVYNDVAGLSPSSAVTINGLKVGQVTKISFLDSQGTLLVKFTVENDFKFSENSIAQIYGGNIIGGKSLAILPKYQMGDIAKSGDTLKSDTEEGIMELVNDRLTPLQEKVENTIVSADSLVTAINKILNDSTRHNIRDTFEDLNATVSSFKVTANTLEGIVGRNSDELDRTFTNLDEMTTNFNNFSDTLTQMDIGRITNNLEKVVADFENVSDKLNNKEGTLGKLINDDGVYNNLDNATKQLEQLLQDVKLNPKRYVHFSVFGKNPEPYQEPEVEDSLK
ncbi:phospholipid/cholesterol/gamma-HCH transport system substrate-binding protein [Salegentibacter sp. 24]|uniref:MlaD family protein n=1 Tax=Salegentibacter sp. 24 TaxID=2183986 RepID=UPI00105D453D|nr:MlaD family protein [Salegentibacter sp. 24]TDN89396.1 phospholipid/cholesterol/gamma-HCH transport system substrate-binding protein [Salegentibacter sp. 24]